MSKKILYEESQRAKYRYSVPRFDGTFDTYYLKCLVLGETDKSYYIQILEHTSTRSPGEKFYVSKKNVIFERKIQDNSDLWYNNMESREIL